MVWRYSLHNPRTNRRLGFVTLESLLMAMQAELADDEVDRDSDQVTHYKPE
jgi:hypothetical protein